MNFQMESNWAVRSGVDVLVEWVSKEFRTGREILCYIVCIEIPFSFG